MAKSLADQLLKAGLVDANRVKKVQQEQRKQAKQSKQKKGAAPADEVQARLAQQREEKARRDRELNQRRLESERQREVQAQVRQIIEQHGSKPDGDIRFNFTDSESKKIRHIYVTKKEQDQLAAGTLAICRLDQRHLLMPIEAAERVAARQADAVVFRADNVTAETDDDPYKDYPIPDDLVW